MQILDIRKAVKDYTSLQDRRAKNAQVTINPSDYIGTWTPDMLLTYVYFQNRLLEGGEELVTVQDGIKKSLASYIYRGTFTGKNRTANFVASNNKEELVRFLLTPTIIEIAHEVDYLNLRETWFSELQDRGVIADAVPPELIRGVFLETLLRNAALINAHALVRGSVNTPLLNVTPAIQGFEPEIRTSPLSFKVQTPFLAITALAIDAPSGNILATIPSTANMRVGTYVRVSGIVDGGGGTVGARLNNATYNVPLANVTFDAMNVDLRVTRIVSATQIELSVNTAAVPTPYFGAAIPAITIGTPTLTNARLYFVNETNAVDYITAIWYAVPERLRTKENFKMWVSPYVLEAYKINQGGRFGNQYETMVSNTFLDKALTPLPEISPLSVIGIAVDNAYVGMDSTDDGSTILEVNLSDKVADYNYRFRLAFAAAQRVAILQETVINVF